MIRKACDDFDMVESGRIYRILRNRMKSVAASEGMSKEQWLHRLLCVALGMEHLLMREPGPAPVAAE